MEWRWAEIPRADADADVDVSEDEDEDEDEDVHGDVEPGRDTVDGLGLGECEWKPLDTESKLEFTACF